MNQLSWKPHEVKIGNPKDGYRCVQAQMNITPGYQTRRVYPYSMARMDNGELIIVGAAPAPGAPEQAVTSFSTDDGATWTAWQPIPHCFCRCMNLIDLGKGELCMIGAPPDGSGPRRYISYDYGRSWPGRVPQPGAENGMTIAFEGNSWADRDANGNVTRIGEIGFSFSRGPYGEAPTCCHIRWSEDGGLTWPDCRVPEEWLWTEEHFGKTVERSVSEGSLVRAANGWLIAALRADASFAIVGLPNFDDSLEGTATSISKDDGKTWSKPEILFDAGRHHANLICMPDGTLVMSLIRRVDMRNGELASYRRGCDALTSTDNGLTWNLDQMFILDEFTYCQPDNWVNGVCGHLCAAALEDGSVITAYGSYNDGTHLIRWKPEL